MDTIGERIYHYRKKIGLSQDELADKVGVSRQSISKWEMNAAQPSAENLKALSVVLQVSVDCLLSNSEQDVLHEVAATEIKDKKPIALIIIACVIAVLLAINLLWDFLIGFTAFSTNVGDDYLSTKQVDVNLFIILMATTVLFLVAEIIIVLFIRKRKK